MSIKEIIQRLEAKYGITGKEGFTEELVVQIEAEIEKGIDTVFEWSEQYSPIKMYYEIGEKQSSGESYPYEYWKRNFKRELIRILVEEV